MKSCDSVLALYNEWYDQRFVLNYECNLGCQAKIEYVCSRLNETQMNTMLMERSLLSIKSLGLIYCNRSLSCKKIYYRAITSSLLLIKFVLWGCQKILHVLNIQEQVCFRPLMENGIVNHAHKTLIGMIILMG